MSRTTAEDRLEYVRANGIVSGARVTWLGQPGGKYRIGTVVQFVSPKAMVKIAPADLPHKWVDPTSLLPGWPEKEVRWW